MQTQTKDRQPVRTKLIEILVDKILTGELVAGQRVVESNLAESFGASRTPLREALLDLERRGLVVSEQDRGFSVASFSAREVREIYPIIWTLEHLALSDGPKPDKAVVAKLRVLNSSFAQALKKNDPMKALQIDTEWHETLVSASRNVRLASTVRDFKLLARRYEFAFMEMASPEAESVDEHAQILDAIELGVPEDAARILKGHWQRGMASLLEQLGWS